MPARHILLSAGAGLVAAVLFGTVLTGSAAALVFINLAPLPLFAIGLSLGVKAAAVAAVAGTVAVLAFGGLFFGVAFGVMYAASAALLSRQALLNRPAPLDKTEWYPPGRLIMWVAGGAAASFAVLLALASGVPGGLEGMTRGFAQQLVAALSLPDLPQAEAEQIAMFLGRSLPGMIAVSWFLMIVANGALAQSLLARFGHNLRPSPRMSAIELPGWLVPATAIAAIGAFMPGLAGFVGGALLAIALTAFAFAGLAVIHTFAQSWGNRTFWLVAIYSLVIAFTWLGVLIAVLGIIETGAGLRRRIAAQPPQT